MKTICSIMMTSALLAPLVSSQTTQAPQMRDAATHAQLSLAHSKSEQVDPMRKMVPAKGPDPSLINPPKDLIANSDIICFGGLVTLVPKRAILGIPKNLADRLKIQPGSKIRSWADFYAQNRGWITTVEVSRTEAEGNKPLAEEVYKRIGKSTNLVVATYQGGPISVLPLTVPVETPKGAPAQTAKKN
jgi:hypothetical protein